MNENRNKNQFFILLILFSLIFIKCNGIENQNEIFISAKGSDSNIGTRAKPFLTLEMAKKHIRQIRQNGNLSQFTVYLREGTYKLKQTFLLESQDSNITFKAYKNEIPVITGGEVIRNWQKLESSLPEISEKSKGEIWVANIPKGWLFHYLFVNGKRAERSKSTHVFWRDWPKDHQFGEPEKKGQLVTFQNKEQLKYLPSNQDAEMLCIMYQYGVMGNGVITDVNPEEGTLRWNSKQTNLKGSRDNAERGYRFENALCFIDTPGEWAVDSEKGKVYYWPKENDNLNTANVIAPKLNELVRLQGDEKNQNYVKNVSFKNLTFIYSDRLPENQWPDEWLYRQWENVDAAIYLSGTEDCSIEECRILQSGSYGITMNRYNQRNKVEKCEIGWTGSGGVFLEGYGPGTLDVNKNNIITRNYIHDHGLGNYWHSPSIQIYQSGHNTIDYNVLQRSAYSAISIVGMYYGYMNRPSLFFPGTYEGQWHSWNYFRLRSQDFPKEIQEGIRDGSYEFDRETMKPYIHSRNNLVEYNIISEPHSKLNEGGALYAWCLGKGNVWRKNVIFKSRGMPSSSIMALDDVAEYTTVQDNVYWINGVILNGVGARGTERGNVISGNIRVNFKKNHKERYGQDKLGTWYTNTSGREPLDNLLEIITDKVTKLGGWPGNCKVGIPSPNEKITRYGEEYVLPVDAHVTIE